MSILGIEPLWIYIFIAIFIIVFVTAPSPKRKRFEVVPVKKFYWQVYPPDNLVELLTVPLFKRITVGFKYYVGGKYVGNKPYIEQESKSHE